MTRALPATSGNPRPGVVHIADVEWPVYKVEALLLGVLVFVGVFALTTSLQPAVLTSAAVTVVAWWSLLLVERRTRS